MYLFHFPLKVLIVVIFLMSIRCHRKENIHGIDQRDIQVIENKRKLSEATLLFQEKYHFPVTQSACDNYTESQMIDGQTGEFIPDSIFLERYLIFNALRQVIGFDVKISFQCTDEFSFENLSYAGYFGSQNEYKLSKDSNLYNSLQTYQSDIIYVGRQELQRAASQYVFQFLNILFYFGILLIPFVTGLILLLFKTQKSSIYGYQGQVFSVFRYINRQGDQQMLMWVHKILAFFVALFFFFHYALLLSQMTTQRISVHLVQDFKKNSYRDGVQSQVDLLNQGNSYYLLMVDVFQYSKLTSKFIVNKQLLSSDRQSYFLHLSKSFFSLDEREQIEHQLLEETQNSSSIFNKVRRKSLDNITFLESPLEVNDSSFYLNGFIIAVAFISGLFFKLIQSKVAIFNKFTEIKVHREHCNSDIIKSFRVMFAEKINQLLSKILLANHLNNFNQLSISKNNKFLGKQIYKIIQKRRKRHVKHKKKKINTLVSESKPSEGAQKNVYQSIKQYLLFERKNGVQAARSFRDSPRRQGIVSLLNRPTMTSKQNELNIDLAVSNAIPFNSIQKNKTFSKDNQAEENFSADRKSFQRSVSNVSKRNNFLHFSLTHNSLKNPSTMLESKLHASIFQPKQPLSAHNDTIQSISSENNMPQAIKRSNEFTSRRDENNLKSSQNQQNNLKINLEDCLEDSQKEELDQYNNEFFEAIKSYNSRQQSSRAEIDLNRQEEEKQGHLSFQFHDNNQQAAHSSHIINSPTQIDTEGELVNKSKKMNSNNAEEQSSIDPTLLKKKSYHDNQGKKMRHSSSSHHSKKQKASSNKQTIPKYQSNSISIFQQQYQVNSIQLVNFSNLNELHSHAISVHSNQSKEDKKKQQKQNSQQSISSTEEQQSVGRETLVKISIPPIQYHLNDKQQKSKSGQKTPPEHQTTGSSEKSSNFIKHQNSSSQEINKKISLNSESKSPCNFLSLNATPEIKNEMNLFTEDDMLPDSHLIKDESSSKERRNDNTLRQIF